MYNSYDGDNGVGDPVGHYTRVSTFIGRISIDVWGHDEGKEETEKIADLIAKLPGMHEQNRLLTKDLCDAQANLGRAYKGIKHRESILAEVKAFLEHIQPRVGEEAFNYIYGKIESALKEKKKLKDINYDLP
jgi:hypothetical protein